MRSRKRSHQNKPLERLALFKAKPVNRDTLEHLDSAVAAGARQRSHRALQGPTSQQGRS